MLRVRPTHLLPRRLRLFSRPREAGLRRLLTVDGFVIRRAAFLAAAIRLARLRAGLGDGSAAAASFVRLLAPEPSPWALRGVFFQSSAEAMRAPSAIAPNFAQTICESTIETPAKVAKPQSVPATTRSRPTTRAKFWIRWATNSGCSMKLLVESITP